MDLFTAKKLTALRKHNGLSQEALAEKIGVSRQAISKWERGEASPDTENLLSLSKIYSVSLDDLLGEKTADELLCAIQISSAEESEAEAQEYPAESKAQAILFSEEKNAPVSRNTDSATSEKIAEIIKRETADLPALGRKMLRFPFFLIAVIGYLAIGFSIKLWHPTWLIFLTIPAYYLCAISFMQKTEKKMLLLQPVYLYAIIVFLLFGLLLNIWHPTWLVFLAIPAYYWFVSFRKAQ